MHDLDGRLQKAIRKQALMRAGDRVAVAVSGGADSVALLLLLLELRGEIGIVLSVVHVNHKLRGAESDGDEQFVRQLAAHHQLEFYHHTAPIPPEPHSGIEAEARRLRYECFRELMCHDKANQVTTAHTLDDQAETVLLRMFRGTGLRGLGGILPRLNLDNAGKICGQVVRPLLGFRRAELRDYLTARQQSWREDSSNQDEAFLRNRLRKRLLPLMAEDFGDAAIEHLAELAEIARAEGELSADSIADSRLSERSFAVDRLLALPLAAQRRIVKSWIETNVPHAKISFRLIESVLELARERTRHEINLPIDHNDAVSAPRHQLKDSRWIIRTGPENLIIEEARDDMSDYQYTLRVPGDVFVPELQTAISAELTEVENVPEAERTGLLDAAQVGSHLIIRNWRAGDRYWPSHTKQEKKIKELLTERHITGPEKKMWPVAESEGKVVWLRDFPATDALRARTGPAVCIRDRGHTS